jgi:hypothetical protein
MAKAVAGPYITHNDSPHLGEFGLPTAVRVKRSAPSQSYFAQPKQDATCPSHRHAVHATSLRRVIAKVRVDLMMKLQLVFRSVHYRP